MRTYRATLSGFFQRLIENSRGRSKENKTNSKRINWDHTITRDDLMVKYEDQDGRCFYSGIPMKHEHHTNWMMSLERLDEAMGYSKDNTVLCCLEFNSTNQWTLGKVSLIIELVGKQIDLNTLALLVATAKSRPSKKGIPQKAYVENLSTDETQRKCHRCDEFQPIDSFTQNLYAGCKTCRKKTTGEYKTTPRGFVINLVGNAKSSTIKRNKKGRYWCKLRYDW